MRGYFLKSASQMTPVEVTLPGPFVAWDGEHFVAGEFPIAKIGTSRIVQLGTKHIAMIPAAHTGGIIRAVLGFFATSRSRAVRK